jgi:hypothetical protein
VAIQLGKVRFDFPVGARRAAIELGKVRLSGVVEVYQPFTNCGAVVDTM